MSKSKEMIEKILEHLAVEGNVVQLTNYARSTVYEAKHHDFFSLRSNGAFVRSGKKNLCIDGMAVRFGAYKKVEKLECSESRSSSR